MASCRPDCGKSQNANDHPWHVIKSRALFGLSGDLLHNNYAENGCVPPFKQLQSILQRPLRSMNTSPPCSVMVVKIVKYSALRLWPPEANCLAIMWQPKFLFQVGVHCHIRTSATRAVDAMLPGTQQVCCTYAGAYLFWTRVNCLRVDRTRAARKNIHFWGQKFF